MIEEILKKELQDKILDSVSRFIKTPECQKLIDKAVKQEIKNWIQDNSFGEILSSSAMKRYEQAIEEAIIKRFKL